MNALALQRNQKEEANSVRDAALHERIESIEQKIQSLLQENLRIEAELKQALDLYQQRKEKNELNKKTLLEEIASLNSEAQSLTESIAALSQINLELGNQVAPTRALKDQTYAAFVARIRAKK